MATMFVQPWRPIMEQGIVQPGAKIWFTVSDTNMPAMVYEDNGLLVPRTNPVIADANGRVPSTYMDPAVTYRVRIYGKNALVGSDIPLEELDPYDGVVFADGPRGDPGGNVMALGLATDVAALSLASGAPAGTNLFHTEGYTSTADGGQAWYRRMAALEADETGMLTSSDGVRLGLVRTQHIPIEAFGAIPMDDSTVARAANDAAIEAAKTFDTQMEDSFYGTVHSLTFRNPVYYFGSAGHDFKLTRRWSGDASGAAVAGGHLRTQLIVPAGCKFLRIESWNTTGETVEGTPTTSAAGSMFVDLDFVGNDGIEPNPTLANNSGYALHPRVPIAAWNCRFRYHWNGVFNNAASGAGGAEEGQASHCQFFLCSFEQNFNAGCWNDDEADDNITSFTHCNFIANARCGLYLGDFLGSSIAPICHFRDNGARTDYFNVSSQCTFGGNRYYVNATATMATTDTALRVGNPSTNSLWTLDSVGGVHPNYPEFTTWTGAFQKGGPVVADRTTSAKHTAVGYYGEGAQPPFFWNTSCFIAPGTCGNLNVGYGTAIIDGRIIVSPQLVTELGKLRLDFASGAAGNNLNIHNLSLAAGETSEVRFSGGYEADGVTPADLAGLYAYPSTASAATAIGTVVLRTRNAGGGGAMDDRVIWDPGNTSYHPNADGGWDLGTTARQWKRSYLQLGVFVGGNQVVGARQSAITSPTGGATIDSQARTAIDAIRAVLSTHGLTA